MKGSAIDTELKLRGIIESIDQRITIALAAAKGNRAIAAKILGISIRSLHRHIKRRKND